jgi:ADP-heptose:LPS heptosyltransferase
MRVVLFKVNKLGDNVAFVSAVQALRNRFPEWQLTLLTTPDAAALYQGSVGPQEVIACPKPEFDRSFWRPHVLASWVLRIRRLRPDACLVSFDQGAAAHFIARLSGARIRIGGQIDRRLSARSLSERITIPSDESPFTWNWRMARALASSTGDSPWPENPPRPDLSHLLAKGARAAGTRKRVIVHAGASGALNQWSQKRFASVAASLSRDFEVVWIRHGSAALAAPDGTIDAPVDSLAGFSEWAASGDLFLGNNSGPMHLANALGCPGVAVTGPSALGWDPCWNRENWTVLRHPDLYCAPCEKLTARLTRCANLASPMACLNYWTEENVENACRSRLEKAKRGTA